MRAFCQSIPVFFRVLLAVLVDGIVAFGPIVSGFLITRDRVDYRVVIVMAIPWLIFFNKVLLWRMDCFWNVRSMQNRTPFPKYPDNYRDFSTMKGRLYWAFLGKDCEVEQRSKGATRPKR